MRPAHSLGLLLALVVGGCAAATPGYSPANSHIEKYRAAAPRGGGFGEDGRYSLTEQEQQLSCKQLTGSVTIKIVQMREAGSRPQPSAMASLAQNTVRPIAGGPTYGASLESDLRRDRARLETLNAQLKAKSCPAFDLDAELKPGNTAPPRPLKSGARKA